MGDLHKYEGTIDVEDYVGISERHMQPSRRLLFLGTPCQFQQDNASPHSAKVTIVWLRRHRVRVHEWPACSPDLSPMENLDNVDHRLLSSSSLVYTTCKTASIDILSFQKITKYNSKKR